MKALLIL